MAARRFFFRFFLVPLAVFFLTVVPLQGQGVRNQGSSPEETILVLSGGTLIDGSGAPPRRDVEVVIRGNRIAAVGAKGSLPYPGSAQVVSTDNQYILPGLIDSHVHYNNWVGELFLFYGITTVADTGNFAYWIVEMRQQIQEGKIVGPRLFVAGNTLNKNPTQGPGAQSQLGVNTPEQARDVTRKLIQLGVDHIKVYTQMTPEMIGAIAEEAHARNLPLHGHIGIDAAEAARRGVDVLEHGSGVAEATAPPQEFAAVTSRGLSSLEHLMDPTRYDSLIRTLIEEDVFITPTLVTYGWGVHPHLAEYRKFDLEFLRRPEVRYFPPNPIQRVYARLDAMPPEEGQRLKTGYRKLQEFLLRFQRAGGKILAGSDVANRNIPGLALHRELQLLVDTGLTPMEAIRAATGYAAQALRKENLIGTVEPGKLADLVVLNADPLSDITNTQKINFVVKEGRILERKLHPDFANPLPRPIPTFPTALPPY